MRALGAAFLFVILFGTFASLQGSSREELLSTLFANYEPSMRPSPRGNRTDISLNITLQHFDFRPVDGSFHFVGHLDVSWEDPKLKWNPDSYGNLTRMAVSQKLVWVPDLEIYNNAPDKMFRMHRNGVVAINYDGNMFWSDTIDVNIFCTTNMQNYPRDTHDCKLSMGSWTYDGLDVDIINKRLNASMDFGQIEQPNMAYKITNFTAMHVSTTYTCCTEPYVTIDYIIEFVRSSQFVGIYRLSAICVTVLGVLSACEGMELRRKLSLAAVAYFILSLHILYLATHIGRFSRTTPSIVKYYAFNFIILTFTTLSSVLSLAFGRARLRVAIPTQFYKYLHGSVFILADRGVGYKAEYLDDNHLNESENNLRSLISSSRRIYVVFRAQRVTFFAAIVLYALSAAIFHV